jgi:hypothetical protein
MGPWQIAAVGLPLAWKWRSTSPTSGLLAKSIIGAWPPGMKTAA